MFSIIAKSLKTGVLTETRPVRRAARRLDSRSIDFSRCTACDDCARACPTGAIHGVARRRAGRR